MSEENRGIRRLWSAQFWSSLFSFVGGVFSGMLLASAALAVLITFAFAFLALYVGNYGRMTSFAQVSSSSATILLVLVTAWYAISARQEVEEHRTSRELERQREARKRKTRADGLRSALISEIAAIQNYEAVAESGVEHLVQYDEMIPKTVYSRSATKLHLLTEEERAAVTHFYSQATLFEANCKRYQESGTAPDELKRRFIRLGNFAESTEETLRENLNE